MTFCLRPSSCRIAPHGTFCHHFVFRRLSFSILSTTMRVSPLAVAALLASSPSVDSFTSLTTRRKVRNSFSQHQATPSNNNLHEFDFCLQEGNIPDVVVQNAFEKRRVVVPGSPNDSRAITMTSSTSTFPGSSYANQEEATEERDEPMLGDDEYDYSEQLSKIEQYKEEQSGFSLKEYVKNADVGDLVVTFAIPGIIAYVGIRFAYNKVYNYLEEKSDTTLDSFASEMVYHDGDFEEMKMCKDDYSRRLTWMGPKRNDAMLKRYLEAYAKKKTVSPQSISSLSYVFTLFNLSELQAANTLVSLCREMGTDKIASSGKLLFFGSRILKSPEGKAALEPIKVMIKSTYRDEEVAETLVETSQLAMAEAAYRAAVQSGGKNQKSLTAGWEVLGLDEETAMRIFEEEAEEGFMTYRETTYGGQTTKYDKHGNALDKEGNLMDPENAEGGDDDDEDESDTGNVRECKNCGYTLFVAKGRDHKFFGEGFVCPQCGAAKDQFVSRTIEED